MKKHIREKLPIIVLFVLMILIHRYVFLYADDFYYARDIKHGIGLLPSGMLRELNTNGRVWVHVLLMLQLYKDEMIFRIVNPIIISLSCMIIAKYSVSIIYSKEEMGARKTKKTLFLGYLLISLFILALPTEIISTNLFYAACSLNYFYPTILSIIFGYRLYRGGKNGKNDLILIITGFFVGASTQQGAMIGLGFLAINFIYKKYFKKIKINKMDIYTFLSWLLGFVFIFYGSYKRSLIEKSMNIQVDYINSFKSIIDNNIFKKQSFLIVFLVLLSSILAIASLNKQIKNIRLKRINKYMYYLSLLSLSIFVVAYMYIYFYLNEQLTAFNGVFKALFTISYLLIIIYTGVLVFIVKKDIFLLNCSINAIGSQFMMILADERFASAYKVMFPAIILLLVTILFGFTNYYSSSKKRVNYKLLSLSIIFLTFFSLKNYTGNFIGYKSNAERINYNLKQIEIYQKNAREGDLLLKKVGPSKYGINITNWGNLPYFMKENYYIKEDTKINYLEE